MATVIVDELVRNGIDRLVLSPGSRSGALAMVAASERRLQTTVAIDERSAAFWALGYAKTAGKPAAVVTTSGTAVANLYPAVIEASESLTPLVIVTADRPSDLRYTGANQTIDQVEIFGRYPRFFADVFEAVGCSRRGSGMALTGEPGSGGRGQRARPPQCQLSRTVGAGHR